jgi:muconolactone delta-isomerase
MRALFVARDKTPPPMEMLPLLFEGFRQWREHYRDQIEQFWFFAGGSGGCGIVTVENEMALHNMVVSWPLYSYSHVQVEILVDGDAALQSVTEMIQSQIAQLA